MTSTETRETMISAGNRLLRQYERRWVRLARLGFDALIEIERGSMGYRDARMLAAGDFRVHGEAA